MGHLKGQNNLLINLEKRGGDFISHLGWHFRKLNTYLNTNSSFIFIFFKKEREKKREEQNWTRENHKKKKVFLKKPSLVVLRIQLNLLPSTLGISFCISQFNLKLLFMFFLLSCLY